MTEIQSNRDAASRGRITIADKVVSTIAGMAVREVHGVHDLGNGTSRAFGSIGERIAGSGGTNISRGIAVEVGDTQAAVDVDVVAEYGVSIPDLAAGIRRSVIDSLRRMTGLDVVEVNVAVDDIHLPSDDANGGSAADESSNRVQ